LLDEVIEVGETFMLDVERIDDGGIRVIDSFAAKSCLIPILRLS
jgi:hypothetical protein